MNNFELHEKAEVLSDTHSPYQLAKMLIQATELLDVLVKSSYGNKRSEIDWDVVERYLLENGNK